jgi:hypothetical protein
MLLCGECYDSLYAFKCKRFRNTRHTAIFGIPLDSSLWNALYNAHTKFHKHFMDDEHTETWGWDYLKSAFAY